MLSGIEWGNIVIDCDDAQKLQSFYYDLLGGEKCTMYGCSALRPSSGPLFLFAKESDFIRPVWPEENVQQQKQIHFDFQVPDLDQAVAYAESIGATKTDAQFGGQHFVTMLDPAGHPFCLCRSGNPA